MSKMCFDESMKILESAGVKLERIDESRNTFSVRRFERALNAAMREVDQRYLDSKYHKLAFVRE